MKTTIIIGGGAAGLFTAISAAHHGATDILVLDASTKPGLKILMSGGGRCNITNASLDIKHFFGESPNAIKKIILQYPPESIVDYFEQRGVQSHIEEPWQKVFPDSNEAQSVLNALLVHCKELGITIRRPVKVTDMKPTDEGWEVLTSEGKNLKAGNVVVAAGGLSYPHTGSDGKLWPVLRSMGIDMHDPYPALTPIMTNDPHLRLLSGLTHECNLRVLNPEKVAWSTENSVLFTHQGLSGPGVLNASQFFELDPTTHRLELGFTPGTSLEEMDNIIQFNPASQLNQLLKPFLPIRLVELVCQKAGIDSKTKPSQLKKENRKALLQAIFHYPVPVTGTAGYKKAEVTGGGIRFSELDLKTMQLKHHAGLYAVGEIVNVHGIIGGYNFQWAWSSAWVCGKAIARTH